MALLKKEEMKNTGRSMLAGCITGMCQICIGYPTKFIKIQLQLEEKFGHEKKYAGMIDCAVQNLKTYGIFGLYRGLNIFFYGARSAVSFTTFETLKARHIDDHGILSPGNRFLCGLYAGAFEAALVSTPLETVECKLIHERRLGKSHYKGFWHGTMVIIKEEGVDKLYKGLIPSIIKQSCNQGIRFFVVETLKNIYQEGDASVNVPKILVGCFGCFAGVCSVFITNPVDVVKTRLQSLNHHKYNNIVDCFVKVWKQEGFFSFYRGIFPRTSRVCVEASFTFMLYDVFKDLVNKL